MPVHPYLGNIKAAIGRAARLLEQFVDLYTTTCTNHVQRERERERERERDGKRDIVRERDREIDR